MCRATTGRDEQLAALADSLTALESATTALDAETADGQESARRYWARRLRADIQAVATASSCQTPIRSKAWRAARIACADGMNFRLFYDKQRGLLSVGYRPADAEGPGRLDTAYYDLLASESRLASFIAIAKGDVPETHWFRLGRPITSVQGVPTLLSWGATMFEYLMPLLVMRRYPETLLDETCRMAVRRQIQYGKERGVPWGISESAYNVVDRHGTYQYRAFGVPGLGLRRGLGDDLVIAPYATALAAMLEPAAAVDNLRRLARRRRRTDRLATTTPWTIRRAAAIRRTAPTPGRARSPRHDRANRDGPPSGHDARVHRQRAARVSDGRAFPRRSPNQGDRAAAAGARARGTCR